jgi:hypothetical protein
LAAVLLVVSVRLPVNADASKDAVTIEETLRLKSPVSTCRAVTPSLPRKLVVVGSTATWFTLSDTRFRVSRPATSVSVTSPVEDMPLGRL